MSIFTLFVKPQSSYHPMWPNWLRYLGWVIRNPFPGLTTALGTNDQKFVTFGATVDLDHPHGLTWNPKGGWNRLTHYVTVGTDGKKNNRVLEFVSYRGQYVECYIGTKPSGSFGIALRHANAKGF